VVIANAGRENVPSLPSTFVRAPLRPMIAPPRTDGFTESVPEEATAEPGGHAGERHERTRPS
jgi:hypothetical protein